MAGGGMGAMPQGDGQQGSIVGMPVGPGMGNPMGGQPGMAGGLGMGGMGFGGGQPGIGFGQGPGYGIDNYGGQQAPQMPQGDTFQPQGGMPTMNMQQIGQMLRGLQGVQPQQMPQVAPQYSASPSMQQPLPQQPMAQPADQVVQTMRRGFFGRQQPAAQPMVQQPQQGIAGLRNQSAQSAMDRYLATRGRRR